MRVSNKCCKFAQLLNFSAMRKLAFVIKKHGVRVFVAIGALLGLSSCGFFSTPHVYGPLPSPKNDNEVVNDTSNPLIENIDTTKTGSTISKAKP